MKLTTRLAAALIATISITAGVVGAQPQPKPPSPGGLVIRKLPPGMTQQEMQQRLAPTLARLRASVQNQAQQRQRQAKAILDATANERAAVNAALNKDPRYKMFVEQMKRISLSQSTSQVKAQRLSALAKANQAIFADAIKAVKINHSALQAKLRTIAPGIVLTPDLVARFGSKLRQNLRLTIPGSQELVLQDPYSFYETEAKKEGVAVIHEVWSFAVDNLAQTEIEIFEGFASGRAEAIIGEYVSVPAGVKRVEFTVSASLTYHGHAYAFLGGAHIDINMYVAVSNAEANQFDAHYVGDSIVAPVASSATMDGSAPGDYIFSFNVPANGGVYFVVVDNLAVAGQWAATGANWARADAILNKITVRYFYE